VDALKFWNQQMKYDAEPGKFNVFIGVDSARVKQASSNCCNLSSFASPSCGGCVLPYAKKAF
jgi:hypothetical protein